MKDFIKIFNEHEQLNAEYLKKEYFSFIEGNFLSTNYKFVKKYFELVDYSSESKNFGFLYKHKIFLGLIYYYSGLNSYDVVNAIKFNVKQMKVFPSSYIETIKLNKLYQKAMQSYFVISVSSIADSYRLNITYLTSTAKLRCVKTACAVALFRRKYNKLPTSLKQLVPECLPSVPIDPFNGKELKYKYGNFKITYPQNITVSKYGYYIYSVGKNLRDNNGRIVYSNKQNYGKDITLPVVIKALTE